MSRHIAPSCFYDLPSGNRVHPCRLIHKDGTLMWKHALIQKRMKFLPETQAHEAHIVKTAQRVEELNAWVSQDLDPWEFLKPVLWYCPKNPDTSEGISVYFQHTHCLLTSCAGCSPASHQDYETLKERDGYIYFRRC